MEWYEVFKGARRACAPAHEMGQIVPLTCTHVAHAHLRTHVFGHNQGAHAEGSPPLGGAPTCAECVRSPLSSPATARRWIAAMRRDLARIGAA